MKILIMKIAWLCQIIGLFCLLGALPCFAKTLILATSDAPPYMIKATDSGLDIEIPRTALKRVGYDLIVQYMPLARALIQVQTKEANLTAPMFQGNIQGLYLSEPHVMYRPAAFSLRKNKLKINSIKDIGNYEIITFQGATSYFGPIFLEASEMSPSYNEHFDMTTLIKLLYAGRTDLVVLDYNIFYYFRNQTHREPPSIRMNSEIDAFQPITFHDVFLPVPAVVAFHDKTLRDLFNKGLKAIRADGTHAKIIEKYIKYNRNDQSPLLLK